MYTVCVVVSRRFSINEHLACRSPVIVSFETEYSSCEVGFELRGDLRNMTYVCKSLFVVCYEGNMVRYHEDGWVQDWGISSANALEIPQSCTKPSTFCVLWEEYYVISVLPIYFVLTIYWNKTAPITLVLNVHECQCHWIIFLSRHDWSIRRLQLSKCEPYREHEAHITQTSFH